MLVVSWARATLRSLRLMLHLLSGLGKARLCQLRLGNDWHQTAKGQRLIRQWMQTSSRIIGLQITTDGMPLQEQGMMVCNHISFLDILAVSSITPVRFLAKHTVSFWPLIGRLSKISGSLFIKRGSHRQFSRSLINLREALKHPRPVLIFPEGTTTAGVQVLPFHSGLFQAAIDLQVPLQPVVLHYHIKGESDRLAAYIERDNFILNLLRLMAREKTEVNLSFTPPVDSRDYTRRGLSEHCRQRISRHLASQQHHHSSQKLDVANKFVIIGECKPFASDWQFQARPTFATTRDRQARSA